MASHLESLTAHYDQMSRALREEELGQPLSAEDMEGALPHFDTILIH